MLVSDNFNSVNNTHRYCLSANILITYTHTHHVRYAYTLSKCSKMFLQVQKYHFLLGIIWVFSIKKPIVAFLTSCYYIKGQRTSRSYMCRYMCPTCFDFRSQFFANHCATIHTHILEIFFTQRPLIIKVWGRPRIPLFEHFFSLFCSIPPSCLQFHIYSFSVPISQIFVLIIQNREKLLKERESLKIILNRPYLEHLLIYLENYRLALENINCCKNGDFFNF